MPAKSKMTAYLDYSTTAITFDDSVNEFMKLFHAKEFANWETIYDTKKKWDTRRGNLKKNIKKSIEAKTSPTALAYQMYLTYIKNTIKCDTDDILKAITTKHNGSEVVIDYNKHYNTNNDMINNYIDIAHKNLYKHFNKIKKQLEEYYEKDKHDIKDIDRNDTEYKKVLEKVSDTKKRYKEYYVNNTTAEERATDRPHLEKLIAICNKHSPYSFKKFEKLWGEEVPVKIATLFKEQMCNYIKKVKSPKGVPKETYFDFKFDIKRIGVDNKDYIYNRASDFDNLEDEFVYYFKHRYYYWKEFNDREVVDYGEIYYDFNDSKNNSYTSVRQSHIRPATLEEYSMNS